MERRTTVDDLKALVWELGYYNKAIEELRKSGRFAGVRVLTLSRDRLQRVIDDLSNL